MEHRNRNILGIGIIVLCAMLQSCYYDNEEELYPLGLNACDTMATITYANTIEAITMGNCANSGCHVGVNPSGGLVLETYQQVKNIADNGKLSSRVLVDMNMPPSGPLSNCELDAIQQWIINGAPAQ